MPLPLVTIVTPCLNQALFLGQTIQSVAGQDYPHIEYLVFDGGSKDGSVEIIQGWAHAIDFWISRSDAGQADAINRGWQRSHGEILAWLNSDDTYQPGAVSAVVETFHRYPRADVVTGDCQVIDGESAFVKNLPSGDFDMDAILSGNSLPQPGVFCRRSAVERVGWLDTGLRNVFDWALWLRLGLYGAKFAHLPKVIASFRIWGQSKTGSAALGASLSGGIPFARERSQVLAGLAKDLALISSAEIYQQLYNAWMGSLLELALLHHLAGDADRMAAQLSRFFASHTGLLDTLPHPQAMAAHMAYFQGDAESTLHAFLEALATAARLAGVIAVPEQWERNLWAEIYVVRAWHAIQSHDPQAGLGFFVRAMRADSRFALRRRVASPALKCLWAVMLGQYNVQP
jgi:hypothetical protein